MCLKMSAISQFDPIYGHESCRLKTVDLLRHRENGHPRLLQELLDFEQAADGHMSLNLENPSGHYALRMVWAPYMERVGWRTARCQR